MNGENERGRNEGGINKELVGCKFLLPCQCEGHDGKNGETAKNGIEGNKTKRGGRKEGSRITNPLSPE